MLQFESDVYNAPYIGPVWCGSSTQAPWSERARALHAELASVSTKTASAPFFYRPMLLCVRLFGVPLLTATVDPKEKPNEAI